MSFEIANSYPEDDNDHHCRILSTDENRARLQVLTLVNDCCKYKMELMTNGAVVADAPRYVEQKKEELTTKSWLSYRSSPKNDAAYYYEGCLENLSCYT
jgi:hypothetical protein